MSEINKNIDSIGKNLEFKSFIFITLFGAWLWLLNHFISGISSPPKEMINPIVSFVFICGFFVSYIIFYSLVNLGIMLMYSSIYQIEERNEKAEGLKVLYGKRAKVFFGWWPMALIFAPGLILAALLSEVFSWYYILAIFILYIVLAMRYFFKKVYSVKDVFGNFKAFGLSFFGYLILFAVILSISHLAK